MKQKIINNLYESELFEPSIARTAHKAATLIEKLELYPRFSCEKIVVPPPKPKPEEPGTPS